MRKVNGGWRTVVCEERDTVAPRAPRRRNSGSEVSGAHTPRPFDIEIVRAASTATGRYVRSASITSLNRVIRCLASVEK